MSSQPEHSFDLEWWKNLKQYLKSEILISPPATHNLVKMTRTVPYEANKIKITVTNTAPINPDYPKIVFTGIVLSILRDRTLYGANLFGWAHHIKIERPDLPSKLPYEVISGTEFVGLTSDEQKYGEVLFPGQFVVFEIYVPIEETPHLKFRVEGGISRRYFFHVEQELT